MYDAILLDFYGTLVAEDDAIIASIVQKIADASPHAPDVREVMRAWDFKAWCNAAHGDRFETQRVLERKSLRALLRRFEADLDADAFLEDLRAPVCIASNIDRADLEAAIRARGWHFDRIVTSEDCRAYKPRAELFTSALETFGARPARVLHVGDSLGSDVAGALGFGLDVLWLNRNGRKPPAELRPTFEATSLADARAVWENGT